MSIRYVLRGGLVVATGGLVAALIGAAKPAVAVADGKASQRAVANAADYAGEEICLSCHEGQGYSGTAHALKANPRTPGAKQGCESCHGPGKSHVEAGGDKSKIVNPGKLKAMDASETCTTCHNRSTHALWDGSQHDQRNVGCTSCHSVHSAKGEKQTKAPNEPELCATCHASVVKRQHRFNHMPVREGKLTCSGCHNVHGSQNVRLLKTGTTVSESCASCHADKRGPYLWEHAPVADNCTICHDPHGSNNDRMLVAKQPYICQRCHVTQRHPPTIYEGYTLRNSQNANKIFGKSCASCHQQVHGSNAPSGKAFLR